MEKSNTPAIPRDDDGRLSAFAWPGGYSINYLTADGGILCATCARSADSRGLTTDAHDPQWFIVGPFIHWEGEPLYCDDCYAALESEYGPIEGEQL